MTYVNTEDPITLDELLHNELHLVTYSPRYGGANVGVFIAGSVVDLANIADSMTSSGDYCDHICHMLHNTPYFPWGEGNTFSQALEVALSKVNSFQREHWTKYAFTEVLVAPQYYYYRKSRYNYKDWEPLPSMETLMTIPDDERPTRTFRSLTKTPINQSDSGKI